MKRIVVIALLAVAVVGCAPTQDAKDRETVDRQQQHYATVQPIPFYDYSLERDLLIQLYNIRNESRQTTAVIQTQGTGALIFQCPAIGDGIAADQQLTNPLAPYYSSAGLSSGTVVEQAEPNGVYSSKNTDATYVLCIRDNGDVAPVYTEHKVTTFPFDIEVGADGVIRDAGGDSTVTVDLKP